MSTEVYVRAKCNGEKGLVTVSNIRTSRDQSMMALTVAKDERQILSVEMTREDFRVWINEMTRAMVVWDIGGGLLHGAALGASMPQLLERERARTDAQIRSDLGSTPLSDAFREDE